MLNVVMNWTYPFVCGIAVVSVILLVAVKAVDIECEVCVKFLSKFADTVTDDDRKDFERVEANFVKFCKNAKGKDERFCYYVGGKRDSATGILNELTKPISYHMPAEQICQRLKKKDMQICELKYDKSIDLSTVNLAKLKVKDLKKILSEWDEQCKGCAEKSDFIKKIEELMPKYAPEAASKREEL